MAPPPDPRCKAVSSAMVKKGVTYSELANQIGTSEQHIIDICAGSQRPTDVEFKALASALDLAEPAHTGIHATA